MGKNYTIFLRRGKRGGWFEVIAFGWFLNPKFEIRNPKQIRMFKIQMFQTSNGEIKLVSGQGVFGIHRLRSGQVLSFEFGACFAIALAVKEFLILVKLKIENYRMKILCKPGSVLVIK